MPNFRLEETLVFKNENIFLYQIFFYKEKIKKTKNKKFQPEIFSKISARNAQFQTRRNTVLQKRYFYFYTSDFLQENRLKTYFLKKL
jgi:hypothetical protein